jgi:hypothetical protein
MFEGMIRVARQTDYAARLLLHLASLEEGASASIAEISAQRLLPVPFVRRMVAPLVVAGTWMVGTSAIFPSPNRNTRMSDKTLTSARRKAALYPACGVSGSWPWPIHST